MSGERTEKATPQRRKKAEEKGDVVRSRELISAAVLVASLPVLRAASPGWVNTWGQMYAGALRMDGRTLESPEQFAGAVTTLILPVCLPLASVMLAAAGGALGVGVLQGGGLHIRPGALAFKPQRLNPASAIKQIVSLRSIVRLLKSLVPGAAVVMLGGRRLHHDLLAGPAMGTGRLASALAAAYDLAFATAFLSLLWALLDYAVEWNAWNRRLRMSKQELREEGKEQNGNPQVKGRIRQVQQAMRRRRVKADLWRATVVITNPTHYAVALEFSFETMAAPRVLTKGRDLHAAEIREAARWAGVPLVENPPLARSLYRSVREGEPIPMDLYAAVAAILAYLFREQNSRGRSASSPAGDSHTDPASHAYSRFAALPGRHTQPNQMLEEMP